MTYITRKWKTEYRSAFQDAYYQTRPFMTLPMYIQLCPSLAALRLLRNHLLMQLHQFRDDQTLDLNSIPGFLL